MLRTSNYSLVLFLQFLLLVYDLFVNSFSELLRTAPVIQLVLFIIQDIAILFNIIIIFLMFFNTFVFQAGLVNLLFHKFKGTIVLSAAYLVLSIAFHVWVMWPCCTATSIRGQPCTWVTPTSTRTPYGCARSLLRSAADGFLQDPEPWPVRGCSQLAGMVPPVPPVLSVGCLRSQCLSSLVLRSIP
ncbi:transmembrane protein 138 isoform X1 [Dermochelys coriacea]|uniref:transmembrane protein 138 isoform X1 n=1 Tax=Dermochelys coriacea TaxID=27794 RepID=UPI001CA80A45|nr:transmembrane protein 138 isoform X1 [Dermochelys coriacea]XP_043372575.1 transmembrane protein 138 isoform X1 [Dermochelys coriacea]